MAEAPEVEVAVRATIELDVDQMVGTLTRMAEAVGDLAELTGDLAELFSAGALQLRQLASVLADAAED
jgi:hypothetical protein